MYSLYHLYSLGLLCLAGASHGTTRGYVPFETAPEAINDIWKITGSANPAATVTLRIALTNPEESRFQKHAIDIATPGHSLYRQHLSAKEMELWTTSTSSTASLVTEWLQGNGIHGRIDRDWVIATATVSQIEKLLHTKYHTYENDQGYSIARTSAYSVPKYLRESIDFISPTVQFPISKVSTRRTLHRAASEHPIEPRDATAPTLKACGNGSKVSPNCVRAIYGINYYAKSTTNSSFAIFGTQHGNFNATYLQAFLARYNKPAAAVNATFDLIVQNESLPNVDDEEDDLDTQTSLGLAWPAKGTVYFWGLSQPALDNSTSPAIDDQYLEFLHEIAYNTTVPAVVSTSESGNEGFISPSYARRLCQMYAQGGARGVTFFFSSGDNGALGTQPASPRTGVFNPTFPATCPFVTSVGGTFNPLNESAATFKNSGAFASSGGFSTIFARPSYQDTVVSNYIKTYVPQDFYGQSGFNASGRGFPDISAIGANIIIYTKNPRGKGAGFHLSGGTSASSPLWAGIVALLNDYEYSQGRPSLGFINPWLYGLTSGQGLRDITTGGVNSGIPLGPGPQPANNLTQHGGYKTTVGWDPVTGLGVPVFQALLQNLPTVGGSAGK